MASPSVMPRKLWEHPNPEATNMAQFMRDVNRQRNLNLKVEYHKPSTHYAVLHNEGLNNPRHSKIYTTTPSPNAHPSGLIYFPSTL
jgi:hypothetical protein